MPSKFSGKNDLLNIIEEIHFEAHELCVRAFGRLLPNAGNIGIFCHYDDEYELFVQIKDELTEPSENPAQKYFKLKEPITIAARNGAPQTTYNHLYVRKPDPSPYGKHSGDIDFYLPDDEFVKLVTEMKNGKIVKSAQLYDQSGEPIIELSSSETSALAYVSTEAMAQKVRTKF